MGRRFGWLSGIAALVLVLARLGRLLQPQTDGPPWQVLLASAALLGAVFTATALASGLRTLATVGLNLVGMAVAASRVLAPATLRFGFFPTGDTVSEIRQELGFAFELIQYGAAPVLPVAGLVAILVVVFWTLGGLTAFGSLRGRRLLVALPSLVFYLQLATLDRRAPEVGWILVFALVAAMAVLASTPGRGSETGRVRDSEGSWVPRTSGLLPVALIALIVMGAVGASASFAATVPESGVINWRNRSGIGSGLYGGTSFNLFVGLQQDLVSLSDEPVFVARVSESAPPNSELYWKLITLDAFDGENWVPGAQTFAKQGRARWERPDMRFQGPTVPVAARVRIASLTEQLLPSLYSPYQLDSEIDLITESFRVREDGSIGIDFRTREGWEYEIQANVPQPDLTQLASVNGELSPVFAEAASAGIFPDVARPPVFGDRPEDIETYVELPDDISPDVGALAREVTTDGTTRFENALILEAWFRDSDNFTYSTEVSTGHSSLDLSDWLLDPDSRNHRTGYCEQFATAMSVMARTLGIPSRVVLGFTPGDVQTQDDGSELIVVRQANAHAWVELWMDGQGWMRFDPTPRSDGINPSLGRDSIGFDARDYVPAPDELDGAAIIGGRPGERDELLPEIDFTGGDAGPDVLGGGSGFSLPGWAWWLAGAAALICSVPAIKLVRRRRRLARIRTGDVTAAWEEIVDRLRDLGEKVEPHQTPLEIASSRDAELVPLASIYSAVVYGDHVRGDGRAAFEAAERLIGRRFQRLHRAYSWLVPTSLRR